MAQEKSTPSPQQPQAANAASAAKVEEKKAEVSKTAETAAKKPAAKKTVKKKTAAKKPAAKKTVSKKAAPKKKVAAKKKTAAKKSTTTAKTAKPASSSARNTGNINNPTMEKMMAQGKVNFEKLTQDATDMGRENVEAMIKSSTIFAKGFEDMMRTAMSFAQNTAEKQSKYVKEVLGSKTIHEYTEVQNKIAQANFDDFMSNTTRLTELGVKTLNESLEPLNSQITKGMQKASKMAA